MSGTRRARTCPAIPRARSSAEHGVARIRPRSSAEHGIARTREITIDPNEIEDARWVTREEMLAIHAGQDPVIKPARRGAIAQFLIANWLADRLD